MDISDWINLIAAILVGGGTLFLGIMAWRAIRQTRSIQKAENRHRLLNEIIEWATDVVNCGFGGSMTIIPGEERTRETLVGLGNKLLRYQDIDVRSKYTTKIAKVFGEKLHSAVLSVTSLLNNVRGALPKHIENFEDKATKEMLSEYEHKLRESAINLIEVATSIKTKDMRTEEENMSRESEATVNDEPTLKDIEKHLKRQDRQMVRGTYFSSYIFGATLIFIAFGLLAGKYVLTTELSLVTYSIVMLIGGTVLMGFAWYKRH